MYYFSKNKDFDNYKNELMFLPLGGAGEIGLNLNLYHFNGKWIMVDFGMGFSCDNFPGIDIIVPRIEAIKSIKNKLKGLILTHAHEDHIGAIPYLWPEIRCPIYATKFTLELVKIKCKERGFFNEVKFIEVGPKDSFKVADFDIKMIPITHSIPEMNALLIDGGGKKIFHTGDWKFDKHPIVGDKTNKALLKDIGSNGVLAMVCDSTNIFDKTPSKSEGELAKNLEKIIKKHNNGLIVCSTFASNIARLSAIMSAANKAGRKVLLMGKSIKRLYKIGRDTGYLGNFEVQETDNILSLNKNKTLILCTGCQGEQMAALNKISSTSLLKKGDLVIFSSKIIPGNEKRIYKLYNKIAELDAEILSEKNEFVHVSGHPSKPEVMKMYKYIKPEIAIPVHGESIHLREHAKVAKEAGVPKQIKVKNGDLVVLSKAKKLSNVGAGVYAIDGNMILDSDDNVIVQRRIMQNHGVVFVKLIVINKKVKKVLMDTPGLLDVEQDSAIIDDIKSNILKYSNKSSSVKVDDIYNLLKVSLKKKINKTPLISVEIIEV